MYNITPLNTTGMRMVEQTLTPYTGDLPMQCMIKGNQFSFECIYKTLCPQIPAWLVKTGLYIIIIYILVSWLLWFYFRFGYKIWKPNPNKFIGDMSNIETRIYWDSWIRIRLTKVMLGYIAVVVYFNWGM